MDMHRSLEFKMDGRRADDRVNLVWTDEFGCQLLSGEPQRDVLCEQPHTLNRSVTGSRDTVSIYQASIVFGCANQSFTSLGPHSPGLLEVMLHRGDLQIPLLLRKQRWLVTQRRFKG